mgnify:CR=1 FL=1
MIQQGTEAITPIVEHGGIVAGKQMSPNWLSMPDAILHATRGAGIWPWASNDQRGQPDVVLGCAGDVPTLEILAAADILRLSRAIQLGYRDSGMIGTDANERRESEGEPINTDALMLVSLSADQSQLMLVSLPRDTVDVPMPSGPLRGAFGSVYTRKINAFFTSVRNRADLVPGTDATRGYNGLKLVLGELYGLDIKYFVEVNFNGFKRVVDAVGGVTINVQVPVVDDSFPGSTRRTQRLYIPSGIQHMDGEQALRYARSRNTSDDFDRGARQQRVLLSLREQADPQVLLPRLPELVDALKSAVRTDIPLDRPLPPVEIIDLRVVPAAREWFARAEREGWGELDYSAVLAHMLGAPVTTVRLGRRIAGRRYEEAVLARVPRFCVTWYWRRVSRSTASVRCRSTSSVTSDLPP